MKHHKLLAIISWGTIISAGCLLLLLMFWAFYPYKLVTYKSVPYPMDNRVLKQGDDTYYIVDACKHTQVKPQLQKIFIDGLSFGAAEIQPVLPMGCAVTKVPLHIPRSLPAGVYRLRTIATFQVNPIRTMSITNDTESFTVLDPSNPLRNNNLEKE